jgi:hypothetical protein
MSEEDIPCGISHFSRWCLVLEQVESRTSHLGIYTQKCRMTLPLEKLTNRVNPGGTSTVLARASEEEGGLCVGIRLRARRAAPAKDHEQRRTTEGSMGLRSK